MLHSWYTSNDVEDMFIPWNQISYIGSFFIKPYDKKLRAEENLLRLIDNILLINDIHKRVSKSTSHDKTSPFLNLCKKHRLILMVLRDFHELKFEPWPRYSIDSINKIIYWYSYQRLKSFLLYIYPIWTRGGGLSNLPPKKSIQYLE